MLWTEEVGFNSSWSMLYLKLLPCDKQVKREIAWHRLRCPQKFFQLSLVEILDFLFRPTSFDTPCYLGHNTSSSRWHQPLPVSTGHSMILRAKPATSLGNWELISTLNHSVSLLSVWLSSPGRIFLTLKWKYHMQMNMTGRWVPQSDQGKNKSYCSRPEES